MAFTLEELRNLLGQFTNGELKQRSRRVPPSAIPWVGSNIIYINGRAVDTSVLDSLAYHAGYFNQHPFNVEQRSKNKPRKLSNDEWLGLPFNESSFGAAPILNYSDKAFDFVDAKTYNRVLGNSNYIQQYGSVPQYALMRDWRYLDSDTDHTIPAIQHAYSYYQQGKYNPGMSTHSDHVERDGKYLWGLKPVQEWWNSSGNKQYQSGSFQRFSDDNPLAPIARKRPRPNIGNAQWMQESGQVSSQKENPGASHSVYDVPKYLQRSKKYNMHQFSAK